MSIPTAGLAVVIMSLTEQSDKETNFRNAGSDKTQLRSDHVLVQSPTLFFILYFLPHTSNVNAVIDHNF